MSHFQIVLPDPNFEITIPTYFLPIPSAILLGISTRGILFWILNVIFIFLVNYLGRRIGNQLHNSKFVQVERPNFVNDNVNHSQPYTNNNVETAYKQVNTF